MVRRLDGPKFDPPRRSVKENPTTLRVLVVEAEPLTRWSISETLAANGHAIVEAGDAESAIAVLSDSAVRVDVVLLDLFLPDSHDLSLLARIRLLSPHSGVILMSIDGSTDASQDALALGARRVLAKPFDMQDLPRLVEEAGR